MQGRGQCLVLLYFLSVRLSHHQGQHASTIKSSKTSQSHSVFGFESTALSIKTSTIFLIEKKTWPMPWASRIICVFLLKRLFGKYSFQGNVFLFCKLAEIRERCCSRILWHFQDFSWVSYLCSSWLVMVPSTPPPSTPPKRSPCKNSSWVAVCKNPRFSTFCRSAK